MYKLLLSWRYLRTRYIALASIISVTLGVATLIVVNSVMAGFSQEMHQRLHGVLSDIVIDSQEARGIPNPQAHVEHIRKVLGRDLEAVSAAVQAPAMVSFRFRGRWYNQQIQLIGIDRETYASVSDFSKYLLHPENRHQLEFLLRENGYAPEKEHFPAAGWEHRRKAYAYEAELR